MTPPAHQLLDAAAGYAPVTDLLAAGDPDVRYVDGRWTMHVGAAFRDSDGGPAGVNLYTLTLPPGAALTSDDWSFVTDPDDPGRAQPLVGLPGPGHFDEWLHTPCRVTGRVPGVDDPVERLYYTGTSGRDADPSTRDMAIGVLERVDGGWRRRPGPILTGPPDRPNVLEPKAVYADGKWRVWFQATHHEAGPHELPDCEIHYSDSDDGITGWSTPQVVFTARDNWFDAAVTAVPAGFHLVAARAPNLMTPSVPGLPPQGLWSFTAARPDGDRAGWSAAPEPLLDADAGERWYAGGTYGPCAVHEPGTDVLQVFFTGAAPPEPRPFVLSIGRLEVPLP